MKLALARTLMAMAVSGLGEQRREWALAMEAEFDAAAEAGAALSFAAGCLACSWRQMAAEEEGRFAVATYLLAIGSSCR